MSHQFQSVISTISEIILGIDNEMEEQKERSSFYAWKRKLTHIYINKYVRSESGGSATLPKEEEDTLMWHTRDKICIYSSLFILPLNVQAT